MARVSASNRSRAGGAQAMIFENREDAGRQLAQRLRHFAGRNDGVVLGIPRGGVAVAFPIAQALHLPLEVFLAHKLGVPGQEELAFGAIAAGGERVLDERVIRAVGVSSQQIEQVAGEVAAMLARRAALYRSGRPPGCSPFDVEGKTVILVDDGVATGSSILCALHALRPMRAAKLVLAVPVAPAATCVRLRAEVDDLICLYGPHEFTAVGEFYRDFSQLGDEEVVALLRRAQTGAAAGTSPSGPADEQ